MADIGADIAYEDLHEGYETEERYHLSPAAVEGFLDLYGDRSPVHSDPAFAQSLGFAAPIAHAAMLHGFLSHFVGMRCPGGRAFELSVDMRYLLPNYVGDRLLLKGKVTQKAESLRAVVMDVAFHNETRGTVTARGRVQAAFRGPNK
jgi:acyl dehydratase